MYHNDVAGAKQNVVPGKKVVSYKKHIRERIVNPRIGIYPNRS